MFRNNLKIRNVVLTMLLLLAIPIAINAQSQETMVFLQIEPGSRANGMGNAYVGVTDDAYAGWWNPAATAFNRKTQFAGMHTNWLQGSGINDLFYEYLGWNQFFPDVGNLGLNVVWMDYGSQEHTDEAGNDLGTFSSNEFAVSAIYGSEISPNKIGLGISFKFIYSYLGPGTGITEEDAEGRTMSYAFDLSSKFKDVLTPRLDLGLVLQNVGPDVAYVNEDQKDPKPLNLRAGLSYRVFDTISGSQGTGPIPEGFFKQKLTLAFDASKVIANEDPLHKRIFTDWAAIKIHVPSMTAKRLSEAMENWLGDNNIVLGMGAEYNYLDLISLRGGYFHDEAGKISGPSFGVGLHHTFAGRYRIFADFAMITGGELVDYNRTFSLGLEF